MAGENLENYFRAQQVSMQWLPVLRAMALQLSADADATSLRQLFFNVGQRFADDVASHFEKVDTIDDLEQSLNSFWAQLNWGWVSLDEVPEGIAITHSAAPLGGAFGEEALDWSVGLLEGFYQSVFTVLGANEKMVVRCLGSDASGMNIALRFAF